MREILFRGKRIDNGEWVEGDLSYHVHDGEVYVFPGNGYDSSDNYEVDSETVCQYTGSTDRNGRKIFEGDILSAHLDNQHPEDITYVQITWDGFSWCIRESTEDDVMAEYDCNIFEVCGNIFDNPELVEVKEDNGEINI